MSLYPDIYELTNNKFILKFTNVENNSIKEYFIEDSEELEETIILNFHKFIMEQWNTKINIEDSYILENSNFIINKEENLKKGKLHHSLMNIKVNGVSLSPNILKNLFKLV